MCGIAGTVALKAERARAARAIADEQLKLLRHRGPNSQGVYARGPAVIGQTRLAVVDLDTGDPPIENEDGSLGVALNGEIYDYQALRERLLAEGHTLKTKGDTEVIAHLAETLDPVELCRSIDGMFAFAVWDDRRKRLIIGRDRVGKKPLYWWINPENDELVFGSEIKSVVVHPDVPRRLNTSVLADYLQYGYAPTPATFFEGIASMPPGHVLVWEPGSEPKLLPYWTPPLARGADVRSDMSLPEAAGQVRELLSKAVSRRMVADVPLGAFLSGGIDSSTIVALMAEQSDRPIKTFTAGFDTRAFDERAPARYTAERLGTEHTEFVVNANDIDLVEKLVWHHDQPFGDSSAIPTYLLCQKTAENVTVALSGDGGDELFAGYERFAAARIVNSYSKFPKPLRGAVLRALRKSSQDALNGKVGRATRFAERAHLGLPEAYLSWISYTNREWRERLLPGIDHSHTPANEAYEAIWAGSEGASLLNRLLDLNFRTYLLDDLQPKADRMSMAHSLEVRSPLLDTSLIEFAASLPPSFKQRGWTFKRILREAFSDVLTPELLARPKQGFGVPLGEWFRGDWKSYAQSMLTQPDSRIAAYLDADAIKALYDRHLSGHADLGHSLWTLLTLEVFLRREGW